MATNPVPGMNPWLENRWGDVRGSLVTYTRDQLQARLPPGLRARMQERVFVERADDERRPISPDVHVYERPDRRGGAAPLTAGGVALADPVVIRISRVEVTETYIQIINARSGGRVV